MRRLCFILLLAGVLTPAALAYHRAAGDGTISAKAVSGTVTIRARGAIWGQIGSGQSEDLSVITVVDRDPTDGLAPRVSNYTVKTVGPAANTTTYAGSNLHFQIAGGSYRLDLSGAKISFSAVGIGQVRFLPSTGIAPGWYAVGDDDWQPVPYEPAIALAPWIAFPDTATTTTTTNP